ncbi:hypothetical protein MSAN_00500900 [Mycena sanguinolenta]|uniref:Uncharacterized protein n=1 Tax=Mycena sanguinolenta TaxID=230812 RepID=A0A8H7DEX6_9AGAR|nr:hypothetical protein MSAN_00500900 [Mycena sanguinolenta]
MANAEDTSTIRSKSEFNEITLSFSLSTFAATAIAAYPTPDTRPRLRNPMHTSLPRTSTSGDRHGLMPPTYAFAALLTLIYAHPLQFYLAVSTHLRQALGVPVFLKFLLRVDSTADLWCSSNGIQI